MSTCWKRLGKSLGKALFYVFFFSAVSNSLYSQPLVHVAGDAWQLQVDSAISIIKKYDPGKYELLTKVCDEVDFWMGDFSSCDLAPNGTATIYIAVKDVKLNSINNLACILVHESLHLYFAKQNFRYPRALEEKICYTYELDFLEKIPNAEPWLLLHAKNNQ